MSIVATNIDIYPGKRVTKIVKGPTSYDPNNPPKICFDEVNIVDGIALTYVTDSPYIVEPIWDKYKCVTLRYKTFNTATNKLEDVASGTDLSDIEVAITALGR